MPMSSRQIDDKAETDIQTIRDRSFDRITFFRNLSVVLSKFVSKEKICSFEYRPILIILSNSVLISFFFQCSCSGSSWTSSSSAAPPSLSGLSSSTATNLRSEIRPRNRQIKQSKHSTKTIQFLHCLLI